MIQVVGQQKISMKTNGRKIDYWPVFNHMPEKFIGLYQSDIKSVNITVISKDKINIPELPNTHNQLHPKERTETKW